MTVAAAAVPLLEARALSFYRQDEPVFAPLDFHLHAGELALVEGDNGSGKTTLLRMLAGLLHVAAGELHWRGAPLQRDACAGEILFLGHQLGLKTDLSPRENLRIAAGLHGCREGASVDVCGLVVQQDVEVSNRHHIVMKCARVNRGGILLNENRAARVQMVQSSYRR